MTSDLEKNLRKKYEELPFHLAGVEIDPERARCAGCLEPTDHFPEVVKELKRFSSREINKVNKKFVK